jgi:hypothetical protein
VTEIPLEHPPHTAAIGTLVDEVAAIVAGQTTLEAAGLATGVDGLRAQEAVDEAHRQALGEAAKHSVRPETPRLDRVATAGD